MSSIWEPETPPAAPNPDTPTPIFLTAEQVIEALRKRYTPDGQVPEWVLLQQVRNQQGFGGRDPIRTFDALMVGLWESRGHPVHGFEVKVSRGDWKRELKDPSKADPLVRHVTHWWVAAPVGVVDPTTLPDGWGLQVVDAKGRVRVVREAEKREAQPPTWSMVAAILKRAAEQVTGEARLRAEYERGRKDGRGEIEQGYAMKGLRDERDRLAKHIAAFEEASGLRLDTFGDRGAKLGAAVRMVLDDHDSPARHIARMREAAERFLSETAQ